MSKLGYLAVTAVMLLGGVNLANADAPAGAAPSDYRTPVIPPILPYKPWTTIGSEPPDEEAVLRALPPLKHIPGVYEESRNDIQVAFELILDKIEESRSVPFIGEIRLHYCSYKCSVYNRFTVKAAVPFPIQCHYLRIDEVYMDTHYTELGPAGKPGG
jgi:hypothetical protein